MVTVEAGEFQVDPVIVTELIVCAACPLRTLDTGDCTKIWPAVKIWPLDAVLGPVV